MSADADTGKSSNYPERFLALALNSLSALVRPPSRARRAQAARRMARHALLAGGAFAAATIVLMLGFDAKEIALMPPRGAAGLWPVRIATDFGKDTYVLCALLAMLLIVGLVAPALRGVSQGRWLAFGLRLQFLFLAVLVPLLPGELLKWAVGRGRPFVGGRANPFNFDHFAGTEAYASFPSSHAITACALAFAVAAVWPRTRGVMIAYALLVCLTRLVLLAHHPSDVVAGALIGIVGAMCVRYWFAARGLGFAIGRDGTIFPLNPRLLKRVARGA
jgi:membrane-associated phospholipid phosphatase